MNDLAKAIHLARAELAELNREFKSFYTPTINPDDPKLVEIDQRIDQKTGQIRRLEAMVDAGRQYESAAAATALQNKRKAAAKVAIEIAKNRIPLAAEIDATLEKLGALLQSWREIGESCRAQVAFVHGSDEMPAWQEAYLSSASGNNRGFASAMQWAIFRHQIGLNGITVDNAPLARRPIGDFFTIADCAKTVAERIEGNVTNSLRLINSGDA